MAHQTLFKGQYESIRTLSAQTHRQVHLARSTSTGNEFSVTRFDRSSLTQASRMRFSYEAAILRDLECSALSTVVDFGTDEESAYCVWEWIEGQTLDARLRQQNLTLSEAICVGLRVLEALEQLHAKDLVHLAVRPSKIVFPNAGLPKLLGFGFQAETISSTDNTRQFLESAMYCSPEQTGVLDHDLTAASDLYSLGMVLFACLTGSMPASGNLSDILYKTATWSVPDLRTLNADVPRTVDQIVRRLLEKNPSQRYQTAAGVAHDLKLIADALESGNNDPHFVIGQEDNRKTLTQPVFIGREEEIDQFEAHLSTVALGESRCICIDADSGVGKTRFIQEVVGVARQGGFWVLRGQSLRNQGARPFAGIADILDEIVFAISHDEVFKTTLQNDLKDYTAEICTAVPSMADVFDWSESALAGPEELGESRIIEGLLLLFEAVARFQNRVAIILDDAQWIDDVSLKFVERWTERIENVGGVILVVAMRTGEGNAATVRQRVVTDDNVALKPLKETELKQLLESMAGKLPDEAVELCVTASGGNAFMATAILHGLVETNSLVATASGWALTANSLGQVQSSHAAAELLSLRLQNLPENTRETLSLAAVLGSSFELDLLTHMSELEFSDLMEQLGQARSAGLIWRATDGTTFSFAHDKIREGLLEEMNVEKRSSLDIRCAELLCKNHPDRVFDIAFHYDAANRPAKALPFAMRAAREARSQYALDVAREQYEIARRGSDGLSNHEKFGILSGLGDVLLLMGDYNAANQCLTEASSLAENDLDTARMLVKLGELTFKLGNKESAANFHEQALETLGQTVPKNNICLYASLIKQVCVQVLHTCLPARFVARESHAMPAEKRLACQALIKLSYAYYYDRGPSATLWAHLRAFNALERHQPSDDLAHIYATHAPAVSLVFMHNRADEYAKKSFQLHKKLRNRWGMGNCRSFHAVSLMAAARFRDAVAMGLEGVELLERSGDLWEVGTARYQAAAGYYHLGMLDEAIQEAQKSYETGIQIGDRQAIGVSIEILSRATGGDIPASLTHAELDRPMQDAQVRTQLLLAEGIRLIRHERYSEAITILEDARLHAKDANINNVFTAPTTTWLATALRLELERRLATSTYGTVDLRRKAFRTARFAAFVGRFYKPELPHALRELGLLHIRFGRAKRGIRYLKRSIHVASKQDAQLERALSEKALAEIGIHLGEENAIERLKDASDRIQQMQPTSSASTSNSNISLLDRFDTLLDAGRHISSSLTSEAVYRETREATLRLLRGEHCVVLAINSDGTYTPIAGDLDTNVFNNLVHLAITNDSATTVSDLQNRATKINSSAICLPIHVRGKLKSLVYVSHSQISKLFGENEKRLANYLSAAASVALENANGFEQLQALNENLELVVADRTADLERRASELAVTNSELETTAADLELAKTELECAKNEAESANRAKSSFLAHMSHEIRTPMNAILGFTELLQNGMAESNSERDDYLNTIHSSGRHLLELINDILDISKIEAGKMETECTECSPYDIVSHTIDTFQLPAQQKNLDLSFRVDGTIPTIIKSDPTRIRQIITNLVSNAVKFTDSGFVKVLLDFDPASNQLTIRVRDSGIGLTPAQQATVFEAFTQADGSITRRFGGTGLGLSISKKLAEILGGGLNVESEYGEGTTFIVTIDVGNAEHELRSDARLSSRTKTPSKPSLQTIAHPDTHILVVDDAEANRKLLSLLLRRAGAKVTLAVNGAEAVQLVCENEYDAVLLDMQMPVMDGYTAATQLRAEGYEKPVVALTANAMASDERKCLDAGCSAFLTKPINMKRLLESLTELMPDHFYESDEYPTLPSLALDSQDNDAIIESIADLASKMTSEVKSFTEETAEVSSLDDILVSSLPLDDPDMLEIVQSFLDKLDQRMLAMENALDEENYDALAADAHWLKGVGGTVGFDAFTVPAQDLVDKANEGSDPDAMRTTLDTITNLKNRISIPDGAV